MAKLKWILRSLLLASALIAGVAAAEEPAKAEADKPRTVPFPKGYRDWTHVKSMVIYDKKHPLFDAFSGLHHVYANDKALKALKSNDRKFPNGAALAFDLLDISEASGAYAEASRKFVAVMYRDDKMKDTEGWGWQAWEGGDEKKPVLKDLASQKACAACHKEVGAKGFAFTEWRP